MQNSGKINNYYELMYEVLATGVHKGDDRTGVGTISLHGKQLKVDVDSGVLPIIAYKRTSVDIIQKELAWMLAGGVHAQTLALNGVGIWNEWGDNHDNGYLGKIYGYQWRKGFGFDQIGKLVHMMNNDRHSRRLIVTAWNPSSLHEMNLPPCHRDFQMVYNPSTESFDMIVAQRSADIFLGVPYNISFYALLGKILNKAAGCNNGFELTFNYGDVHIYNNHIQQCSVLLDRYHGGVKVNEFSSCTDMTTKSDAMHFLTMFTYEERFMSFESEMRRFEDYLIDLKLMYPIIASKALPIIKAPVAV